MLLAYQPEVLSANGAVERAREHFGVSEAVQGVSVFSHSVSSGSIVADNTCLTSLGMNDLSLFCTDDLYEGTNMVQVRHGPAFSTQ